MGNNYVVNDLCKMVIEMGFRIKRTKTLYIVCLLSTPVRPGKQNL